MPKSRHWTNKSFSISLEDAETTLAEIGIIAKREGTSVSSIIVLSLKEYVKEHKSGNYQHTMENFAENGEKSYRQIEKQIVIDLAAWGRDIKGTEIWDIVKEQIDPTKRAKIVDNISKSLKDKGVKVWG
jgi:hypothetical protein